jgi:hypothetical protein
MTKYQLNPQTMQRLTDAHIAQPNHSFLSSLFAQANRGLSANQVAALNEILTRMDEEAFRLSSVSPLVSGTYRMTGTIQSLKIVAGKFGARQKMRVLLDTGNTVYCSVPKEIAQIAAKGLSITFSGEVTVSNDDEHFGFVKFPVIVK